MTAMTVMVVVMLIIHVIHVEERDKNIIILQKLTLKNVITAMGLDIFVVRNVEPKDILNVNIVTGTVVLNVLYVMVMVE